MDGFAGYSSQSEIDVQDSVSTESPRDHKQKISQKDKKDARSGAELSGNSEVMSESTTTSDGDKPAGYFRPRVQRAMRSLSVHTQQLISPEQKVQRVYIHCIRHAEGMHNVKETPYEMRKKMNGPRLTFYGEKQAEALATRFKHMDKVTQIICSPMRRTIHTAYLALRPAIFEKNIPIIAYPDVREWGNTNCNTGIKMSYLLKKFVELEGKVETRLAPDGWEFNREVMKPYPEYKQTRALKVRKELWELGQVAMNGGKGVWNGIEVDGVKKGRDVHIVVVSHGAFLATLEGEDEERLHNAEYKTYEFATEEMVAANVASQFDLVETEESKMYVHGHPILGIDDRSSREMFPYLVKDELM
ncbi:histidine phosphatase superfamily [Cadophora sp. MPI-SDFR-AT-0126]|nr:histidine phosphatase superfamily [Leotiomycetes sp. MPI-SDFR-AT-0126]